MNRISWVVLTALVYTAWAAVAGLGVAAANFMANPLGTVRYVAISGSDNANTCTNSLNPCRTIQYAVDQAETGDEIRIAAGAYTGVTARTGVTQTVYLSKTVTLRGGYLTSDWLASDPLMHPTVLNAQGKGRVLYITGDIEPTIEGLRLTGGDATGLHGAPSPNVHVGGGIYVDGGAPIIHSCAIFSNTASTSSTGGEGGGAYLKASNAVLTGNLIQGNTAASHSTGWGGGVYVQEAHPTLSHNRIQGNTASSASMGFGGGVYLSSTSADVVGNSILNNVADNPMWGIGGGIYVHISDAGLSENIIRGNTAKTAGGVYLYGSDKGISGALVNTVIAENKAGSAGSGLYAEGVDLHLLHVTVSGNTGGDGSGVHVATFVWGQDRYPSTAELIDTILVDHSVGITVSAGSTATLDSTLWHDNDTNWAGDGAIHHERDHTGDPLFTADGYHLTGTSAARDAGVYAGITVDIDGERRPMGRSADIGADEFPASSLYLPTVFNRAALARHWNVHHSW